MNIKEKLENGQIDLGFHLKHIGFELKDGEVFYGDKSYGKATENAFNKMYLHKKNNGELTGKVGKRNLLTDVSYATLEAEVTIAEALAQGYINEDTDLTKHGLTFVETEDNFELRYKNKGVPGTSMSKGVAYRGTGVYIDNSVEGNYRPIYVLVNDKKERLSSMWIGASQKIQKYPEKVEEPSTVMTIKEAFDKGLIDGKTNLLNHGFYFDGNEIKSKLGENGIGGDLGRSTEFTKTELYAKPNPSHFDFMVRVAGELTNLCSSGCANSVKVSTPSEKLATKKITLEEAFEKGLIKVGDNLCDFGWSINRMSYFIKDANGDTPREGIRAVFRDSYKINELIVTGVECDRVKLRSGFDNSIRTSMEAIVSVPAGKKQTPELLGILNGKEVYKMPDGDLLEFDATDWNRLKYLKKPHTRQSSLISEEMLLEGLGHVTESQMYVIDALVNSGKL